MSRTRLSSIIFKDMVEESKTQHIGLLPAEAPQWYWFCLQSCLIVKHANQVDINDGNVAMQNFLSQHFLADHNLFILWNARTLTRINKNHKPPPNFT